MDGSGDQLALFDSSAVLPDGAPQRKYGRKKRGGYVPKFEVTDAIRQTNALLDQLLALREGLKPYEGRCVGCGKVIAAKAPNCNRRWCKAVWKCWSRDQRRVVREPRAGLRARVHRLTQEMDSALRARLRPRLEAGRAIEGARNRPRGVPISAST